MNGWPLRFVAALLMTLLPAEAFAYSNLACSGATPVGYFYDTAPMCTGITGVQNLFSGLVCDYQVLLNDILSRVYCGMQLALIQPLKALIVIFIILYGLQFMAGFSELSVKEVFSRLLKLSLVLVFAVNSGWGIGIAYNFFIGGANEGIAWVLSSVLPSVSGTPNSFCVLPGAPGASYEMLAFRQMDYLVCQSITGPFTQGGMKLAGFIGVLSFIVPPIFLMFVYFSIKTVGIFIRGLLTYLVGVSAIAFLIALGPIFISMALFKPTYRFFDDWLRFIVSFVLQIVLIFAAIALWMVVMKTLGNFFADLIDIIVPVKQIISAGPVSPPVDTWGLCTYSVQMTALGPKLTCVPGGRIIYPSQLPQEGAFIFYIVLNLLSLCIAAYAFDTLLKNIPNLARQLAGPAYSPQLGGGEGLGAAQYPGMRQAGSLFQRATGGNRASRSGGENAAGRTGEAQQANRQLSQAVRGGANPALARFLAQQNAVVGRRS